MGTNSVLMLVARRAASGDVEVLADRATITRLGRSVDDTRHLSAEGIEATLETLRAYATEAQHLGATQIRAVGTSALRDAENATAFCDPARNILGGPVEVVTGLREAALTYRGALEGLALDGRPLREGTVTVMDVGGGSTEIVRGEAGRATASESLDVGSVRLTERLLTEDPPSPRQLAAVEAQVTEALQHCTVPLEAPFVGIAGTVTTLAALARGLDDGEASSLHGTRLSAREVRDVAEGLARTTVAQRRELRGLHPRRADVIVAGAWLVRTVMAVGGLEELWVSDGGVRVGLASELLDAP